MKWKTFAIGCALALAVFVSAQRRPASPQSPVFTAVLDLTHTVSEKSPNWEGTEKSPFTARAVGTFEKEGYFSREITLPEHFSTHLDAPAHFARGRWTVDQIPPERLVRPLVVLDVSAKARGNPDYQITMEDVAAWEQVNGLIPQGALVLARTGWSARWNSMKDYRNADAQGAMHFPGYLPDTARFLAEARGIVGLGIDTLSVDYGASKTFPVHKYCAARSIYHLENVDLGGVPEAGATAVVAPAKLEGGSGAPVRVFALVK